MQLALAIAYLVATIAAHHAGVVTIRGGGIVGAAKPWLAGGSRSSASGDSTEGDSSELSLTLEGEQEYRSLPQWVDMGMRAIALLALVIGVRNMAGTLYLKWMAL